MIKKRRAILVFWLDKKLYTYAKCVGLWKNDKRQNFWLVPKYFAYVIFLSNNQGTNITRLFLIIGYLLV